ncbi:asparagine synthase (glutamine-hydrolyzing) [Pedobacter duraquae]|nr:asparagine synthase (glutamine-hydrolyzing) [Pedobacter duraquae]
MCRISGIISPSEPQQAILANVKMMCNAMAHGGPDGEGIDFLGEIGFAFGHRRLALLDLTEAGHQPMADASKQFLITYNGEIYNYLELKSQLTEYPFMTGTDTEVILAGFAKWGPAVFGKLQGMFAFCLYDHKRSISYLVRDPGGIKPLYYSDSGGRVVFASEIKAFKATDYDFKEDTDWKVYFLAFGHIPEPFTTLHSVKSLPKGHFLTISHKTVSITLQRFCQRDINQTLIHEDDIAERSVSEDLKLAVRSHLLADAKIGVFLSGGIDSSILTLLAKEASSSQLHTLSINFNEVEFSEQKYQKIITDLLDNAHTTCMVTDNDFEQNFEQIMKAIDQPSNDCINSWFVSKYARELGFKAVLSGVGADEMFGGYPSFRKMKIINLLQKMPKSVLGLLKFAPSLRIRRLCYLSFANPIGQYLCLRGFFTPDVIAKLVNMPEERVVALLKDLPLSCDLSEMTDGEKASWIETNLYMQNQLLKDTDVMSMSHGLEIRLPYLDQNLLSTLRKIDPALKFEQERPKELLIKSFINLLPRAIWDRPKMGFTFPFMAWLKQNDKITNTDNYQNAYAKALILKFKKGKLHWSKAFALYQVFNGN